MTRAVIYCRVSTDEEIQINALTNQIEEAKFSVLSNKWQLVDQYIDEGKTGTMTKKRNEYNRLFCDIETDKFDIIVIKSQDRLMRSTKDWYLFIDRLIQNEKRLYFYIENKFYSPEDALITGIKAILAEDYSRELSKKINNAHSHRQRNHGNVLLTSNTWGYDKVGKEVVINEMEAEIVKLMFELCIQGNGARKIANILADKGFFSRNGNIFSSGTIRKIIRNPLFKGTAVMNKQHFDFFRKKHIYNDKSEWIYNENCVPPIVDELTWNEANRAMDLRVKKCGEGDVVVKGVKKGASPLSGKIICGDCCSLYWRRSFRNCGENSTAVWSCRRYVENGRKTSNKLHDMSKAKDSVGCDNIHIKEKELKNVLLNVSEKLYLNRDKIFLKAEKILIEAISNDKGNELSKLKALLAEVIRKREVLLDKFLDSFVDECAYENRDTLLEKQESEIKNQIYEVNSKTEKNDRAEESLNELRSEIWKIINNDLALNFVYNHIEKIVIYYDHMTVNYDIFPKTEIRIEQINCRRRNYTICL